MRALLLGLALWASGPSLGAAVRAQDAPGVWSPEARAIHRRAERVHLRLVLAHHEVERTAAQRECIDGVATRAGSLTRIIEDRAAQGGVSQGTLNDVGAQLDELETEFIELCLRTADNEGVVEVDMWRHPFARRMRRDRAQLRIGARFEMVPRVRRGGYALVPSYALRGAFGGFVTEALRVEATLALSYLVDYGPFGSLGVRALVVAPWSLLRLAIGLEAALIVASDRLGATNFGWVGVQIGIPAEVAFELSDTIGLTLIGGPMYTQAGEVRFDARSIGGSIGLLVDFVL